MLRLFVDAGGLMARRDVEGPVAVERRVEACAAEVLADAANRPVQLRHGGV